MNTKSTRIITALFLALILVSLTLGGLSTQSSLAQAKQKLSFQIEDQDHKFTALLPTPQISSTITILVDDFTPQPFQGNPIYFYNRLEGDRGALNEIILNWGRGQVTATVASGRSWGGVWQSLNHPAREGKGINFSAILPSQILSQYQGKITGLTIKISNSTPGKLFKIELTDGNNLRWSQQVTLTGGQQLLKYNLPPLANITTLLWLIDQASAGDHVTVEHASLQTQTQITDVVQAGFVWSYGMLLNNLNLSTGLVRDKARDASGEFDAIQATGALAAATVLAEQLGIISRADAQQIVTQIGATLLDKVPRYHGLWPHFTETIVPSGVITIVEDTEWSSLDTTIAAIALLESQGALGLDTSKTEQMLKDIDWDDLLVPGEGISHGYHYNGTRILTSWDTFGGESWLIDLAYAAAKNHRPPLKYPLPPTANGSGFIDELAWLFVPPPSRDSWGANWTLYRQQASAAQISYYPINYPTSCFSQLGLFGLSAAEVPIPSAVPTEAIYQPFGVGGRFAPPNDGSSLLGAPVIVPHYPAMIASIRPEEAIHMWAWLINHGYFSPLNNVESLMFLPASNCSSTAVQWNHLKGSWNLALQTLGWGHYLVKRRCQHPVLWQAAQSNTFLWNGYNLLIRNDNPPFKFKLFLPMIFKSKCSN